MKRTLLAIGCVVALPMSSYAVNNIGSCGWGSKLFDGKSGIAPQVLAVTTNGTSGNQTFGITSGTSGCTQDGVVDSNWKTAMFIDGNADKLAHDAAIGQGEALDSLASLLEVRPEHRGAFRATMKGSFAEIFPSADVSSHEVMASLKSVLSRHADLQEYSRAL